MAEREGFEPSIQLPVCIFSKDVLSTTQPPLLVPSVRRVEPYLRAVVNPRIPFVALWFPTLAPWLTGRSLLTIPDRARAGGFRCGVFSPACRRKDIARGPPSSPLRRCG